MKVDGILDCRFVQPDVDLVSEVQENRPDVLCLDPTHLDLNRDYDLMDFGRDIRDASETTLLLGYSFKVNDAVLRAVLDAGFRGCVSKNARLRHVEIALAAVLDGGMYFDRSFGSHLRPMISDAPDEEILSEREKAVLVGLARGLSSKQIAHDLDISSKTVDTYKARAGKKLNLSGKADLVSYVHDRGWIT
ncbi:response regulator transcription factor [Yoonia sp.]|uniref:helix-turn-helix transcriptional regulator n=1 Tax=Yoonia sp. TaxID=2212373 RepID=UPI0025EF26A3|nr:response regulator transcription factor [Yoonia sp.]